MKNKYEMSNFEYFRRNTTIRWYYEHGCKKDYMTYKKYRRQFLNWLYRQKNKLKWIRTLKAGDPVFYDLFPDLKHVQKVEGPDERDKYTIRLTDGYIGYSAYDPNSDNIHPPEEYEKWKAKIACMTGG